MSRVLARGGKLRELEGGGVALLDAVDERLPLGGRAIVVSRCDDVRHPGSGKPDGGGGGDTVAPVS